eukprot:15461730-Alexandrium_andersonii.AAC.1
MARDRRKSGSVPGTSSVTLHAALPMPRLGLRYCPARAAARAMIRTVRKGGPTARPLRGPVHPSARLRLQPRATGRLRMNQF